MKSEFSSSEECTPLRRLSSARAASAGKFARLEDTGGTITSHASLAADALLYIPGVRTSLLPELLSGCSAMNTGVSADFMHTMSEISLPPQHTPQLFLSGVILAAEITLHSAYLSRPYMTLTCGIAFLSSSSDIRLTSDEVSIPSLSEKRPPLPEGRPLSSEDTGSFSKKRVAFLYCSLSRARSMSCISPDSADMISFVPAAKFPSQTISPKSARDMPSPGFPASSSENVMTPFCASALRKESGCAAAEDNTPCNSLCVLTRPFSSGS